MLGSIQTLPDSSNYSHPIAGGVNRHNGIVEGRIFARQLEERGVPASAIRVEDTSANTWQNVQLATPYLTEAVTAGLAIAAVSKWYHRRTIHILRTRFPQIGPFFAVGGTGPRFVAGKRSSSHG